MNSRVFAHKRAMLTVNKGEVIQKTRLCEPD